jgi:hypothetical protein
MADLAHVRSAVVGHNWLDLGDWVSALDELADLSDDEIEGLARETADVEIARQAA